MFVLPINKDELLISSCAEKKKMKEEELQDFQSNFWIWSLVDVCFRAQNMMEMCMIKVSFEIYTYKLIANLISFTVSVYHNSGIVRIS